MDWSGVDYCDVFISCFDSHSDGTHSLQSEWFSIVPMDLYWKTESEFVEFVMSAEK